MYVCMYVYAYVCMYLCMYIQAYYSRQQCTDALEAYIKVRSQKVLFTGTLYSKYTRFIAIVIVKKK